MDDLSGVWAIAGDLLDETLEDIVDDQRNVGENRRID